MKTLYPMDFEEFLLALNEESLVTQIQNCYDNNTQMPHAVHEAAMNYYRQFLVVGGMPDCVDKFVETKDYVLIRHIQKTILASYLNDMSKYNRENEIKKTRLVYDNITVQLSKKNTRFQYKLIKKGGRASEFENAIEWLTLSGIATRIYQVEQAVKPLENYRNIDSFKTYVSDVGLLCAKKDVVAEDVLYLSEELNDFKGGMTENFVCCQLIANGYTCYYWLSLRGAEVDFIIQRAGKIIPVEVKSAENTKAKSLSVYIETYKPEYSIKISGKNFGFENGIKTIPLYATFCL
jgi:predicted AAA+ superfamily ATPase